MVLYFQLYSNKERRRGMIEKIYFLSCIGSLEEIGANCQFFLLLESVASKWSGEIIPIPFGYQLSTGYGFKTLLPRDRVQDGINVSLSSHSLLFILNSIFFEMNESTKVCPHVENYIFSGLQQRARRTTNCCYFSQSS